MLSPADPSPSRPPDGPEMTPESTPEAQAPGPLKPPDELWGLAFHYPLGNDREGWDGASFAGEGALVAFPLRENADKQAVHLQEHYRRWPNFAAKLIGVHPSHRDRLAKLTSKLRVLADDYGAFRPGVEHDTLYAEDVARRLRSLADEVEEGGESDGG